MSQVRILPGPLLLSKLTHTANADVATSDRQRNDRRLRDDARLLSAYETPAGCVWIITEADRSSTCVLLPSEY